VQNTEIPSERRRKCLWKTSEARKKQSPNYGARTRFAKTLRKTTPITQSTFIEQKNARAARKTVDSPFVCAM
jgi:hypothetical protein